MDKNPLLSIIIPVYNAASFLENCINSIIRQGLSSYEIILINDGSIDDSLKICLKLQQHNTNIKVIDQENKGVSAARNTGLSHATGEWIYFCDADDEIYDKGLKELVDTLNEDYDLYVGGILKKESSGEEKIFPVSSEIKSLSPENYLITLFNPGEIGYQGYLVTKLFKRKIISEYKIYFDESIKYNEDRLFILQYVIFLKKNVLLSPVIIYKYILRDKGAMSSMLSKEKYRNFVDDLIAFNKMYELTSNLHNPLISALVKEGIAYSAITNLHLIERYSDNKAAEKKYIRNLTYKFLDKKYFFIKLSTYKIRKILAAFKKMIIGSSKSL